MSNLKELREQRSDLFKKLEAVPITDKDGYAAAKTAWESKDAEVQRAEETDTMQRRSITHIPTFSDPTPTQPVTVNVIPERKPDTEAQMRSQFSLTEAIRNVAENKPLTGMYREMHDEADKEARQVGGFSLSGNLRMPGFLVRAAARDGDQKRAMSVGTTTSGGHTVATNLADLIPILDPDLTVRQAGAKLMTGLVGNVDFPRHTTKQTASWAAETGTAMQSDPVFDKISMTPKRLSCETPYSKTLLVQSSLDIEAFVRKQLNGAIAIALETAALHGTGTSNQPAGLVASSGTAAVGTRLSGVGGVDMGTNGLAITWAKIVSLETAVATANSAFTSTAYIMNPLQAGKLKTVEKGTNTGLFLWGPGNQFGMNEMNQGVGEVNGYRAYRSTVVPSGLTKGTGTTASYIYFGDWSEMMIGQWGGLDMVVDPYTLASTASVRVVVNSWWDVAIARPSAFAVILDALTV